jgi:hypothetical protein
MCSMLSCGQVTIVADGLNNASSLFSLSGGVYYTGNSVAGDRPATSPFASEGSHSRGISNGTATLTSNANINTSAYSAVSMSLSLASFSIGSTGNGADAGDIVTVEVSPDAGTTWYSTVRVLGNSNTYWSYAGGLANASTLYDGNATPVDFAPAGGGNRTTDGYSKITITGLPSVSTLRFRITMLNNSANERWLVDDFKVEGIFTCTPPTISSVYPTSGPAGTEVTINASSGSLIGATATVGGVAASVISSTASQLIIIVPAGGTSGGIVVTDAQPCNVSSAFTFIEKDITSCEGSFITDLIIYEVHDQQSGSGGTITLFNGTGSTKNLSNYRIYRTTNQNDGNEVNYANLTGSIAPGALGIITVSGTSCAPASTNGIITGGFNENDGIQLRASDGTTVIDDVDTYVTAPGYYMVRNAGAFTPRTSYLAADWAATITLGAGVCATGLGTAPSISGAGSVPNITTQPSLSLTCSSTSATIAVVATEGFPGSNPLAYQWYFVPPNTTSWTALTNTGVYTDTTTSSLNISSLAGLDGYQYYCQVRENTATCYIATNAVKIDTSLTTWNGTVWSNGIPSLSKGAVIDGNYTTSTNGSFSACNLTINPTFTVTISANNYIEIQNNIINNGLFNILNNGSLVQVSDTGINTGNINVSRTANVRLQDYVYWSSPVNNFALANVSPATAAQYLWSWNPTVANSNAGEGNWENAAGNMTNGQGYIVRGPSGYSASAASPFTAVFNGVANNGIYTPAIARGTYTGVNYLGTNGTTITSNDDNWNLVGNPYPSAISINSFLTANTNIDGFVRLWSHGTVPATGVANPFYGSFGYNYSAADYIVLNGTGSTTGPGLSAVIGAGQGFFVLMNPGIATTSTVTFKNAMRDKTYYNAQFFKNGNSQNNKLQYTSADRIWLDLILPTQTTRTLIGYVDGATQERDRLYDALTDYKSQQNFYSLIADSPMTIQGRALPFVTSDQVPLGMKIPQNGTFTIAIGAVEGVFKDNNQTIYLEDKMLNIIHDLSALPYTFTQTKGIDNHRFVLRYTNQTLGNTDFESLQNSISVFTSANEIKINSVMENIKEFEIYDTLGRTLFIKRGLNNNTEAVNNIAKSNQALIVKVTLANDQVVTKKIVF